MNGIGQMEGNESERGCRSGMEGEEKRREEGNLGYGR